MSSLLGFRSQVPLHIILQDVAGSLTQCVRHRASDCYPPTCDVPSPYVSYLSQRHQNPESPLPGTCASSSANHSMAALLGSPMDSTVTRWLVLTLASLTGILKDRCVLPWKTPVHYSPLHKIATPCPAFPVALTLPSSSSQPSHNTHHRANTQCMCQRNELILDFFLTQAYFVF